MVSEATFSTDEDTAPTGGGCGGWVPPTSREARCKRQRKGRSSSHKRQGLLEGGTGEEGKEDTPPPQMQGGAQPKKTLPRLPRPAYEGDANALILKVHSPAGARAKNRKSPRSASSSTRASTFYTRCVYPVCVGVMVLEY